MFIINIIKNTKYGGGFSGQLSLAILPCLFLLFPFASCGDEAETVSIDVAGHTLQVEIADTQELRATGLMNRRSLPENHGMLFVFESDTRPSFWMKNTSIPLSLAFISNDGTIRQIEHLSPHSLMSVVSKRHVRYALEVNHGWFEKRAIIPGDKVIISMDRDNS